MDQPTLPDFTASGNAAVAPDLYDVENRAIDPEGLLLRAMQELAPWAGQTIVDLGCGTGYWLDVYAEEAAAVIGVEPDPALLEIARRHPAARVVPGSAEHIPLPDGSVDVVHARFAYFFPPGCDAGLAEVLRVLRPGGHLVVVDNDQHHGEFADLLASSPAAAHTKATFAFLPTPTTYWSYATLALGSAMALFMYPHSVTGVLATGRRDTIRRNTAALPAYSLALAFIALLGYMAIAAHIHTTNSRLAAPLLFRQEFPSWFAGVAYAAVSIGALVPAAIMSIAAANLFTRNIYRDLIRPRASAREEAQVSKLVSLLVKFGALAFVIGLNTQNAINLQLLGGIWILQTFPAIAIGLYTRWLHRWGLLLGWAVAMVYGTYVAYGVHTAKIAHFAAATATIPGLGTKGYIAVTALVLNLLVAIVVTLALRLVPGSSGVDHTAPEDYLADPEGAPAQVLAD